MGGKHSPLASRKKDIPSVVPSPGTHPQIELAKKPTPSRRPNQEFRTKFKVASIRPAKKQGIPTIRYSGRLSLPNGTEAPLILETTKDGYDVLLQDLVLWARWSPPASSLPDSPDEEVLPLSMKILYDNVDQGDSPLMNILKLPYTRSTSKPNPYKKKGEVNTPLRRKQTAVAEYRDMIQEAIFEDGPRLLEWSRREAVSYGTSRKTSPLLQQILGWKKKQRYSHYAFIRDSQLVPELVAAFLFEMIICTDRDLPDCFERANLDRPMDRQLQYVKIWKLPRQKESTLSGAVDYFTDAWRKDPKRAEKQKQDAKKCSDNDLHAFIQSLLTRRSR